MFNTIALAITPTDLLVMSEDLVVPSLLDRLNALHPGLNLTMTEYDAYLKGKGRQALCDAIAANFPERITRNDLDPVKIYKGRDVVCMNEYVKSGTTMAAGAIEAIERIAAMHVELLLVSNNSVARGTLAIKACTNGRGDRLLRPFKNRFYEAQGLQAQDQTATVGTALQLLCQHEHVAPDNTIVLCRASGIDAFRAAGFPHIIGSIGGSKDVPADTARLLAAGAAAVVGPLADLPAAVTKIMQERILQPAGPAVRAPANPTSSQPA